MSITALLAKVVRLLLAALGCTTGRYTRELHVVYLVSFLPPGVDSASSVADYLAGSDGK